MARDTSYRDYIVYDLLQDETEISTRGMFGGFAFYKNGIVFGILIGDKLYFKVGELNKNDYLQYGSEPFTYAKKNGDVTLTSYWEVPVDVLDDREMLSQWITKSVTMSMESKRKK